VTQESQAEEILQNPTSETLPGVLDQLTMKQKRFLVARQETVTDKEAAEAIGIRPRLVYEWRLRGYPIDEALKLMTNDGLVMALHLRRKALAKAMATKVAGLESSDERLRQNTATEIIEWELGRAKQTQEITGRDGGPIETKRTEPSDADRRAATDAFYRRVLAESGDRIPEGDQS